MQRFLHFGRNDKGRVVGMTGRDVEMTKRMTPTRKRARCRDKRRAVKKPASLDER
ncbi:hypothetical protein [Massilibacteroides vaginae]|uniref:hypothetical protein n=1 Tax=Massilibacteroides vaginae TaxID=1673718 RepID=UPI0015944438|nr:hypothetical protein [Massilibacteroides vaginae]